jgi:hypothetical protein
MSSFVLSDFNKYCNSSKGLKAFLLQCRATIRLLQFYFYFYLKKSILVRLIHTYEGSFGLFHSNQWNKTREVVFCNQLEHHFKKSFEICFQLNFNNFQNIKNSYRLYCML